jgi:hypothetical protein
MILAPAGISSAGMSDASNLARRLIAYDAQLAGRILEILVSELEPDTFAAPEVGDPRTTTREWKSGLAYRESARVLARELAELLSAAQSRGSPSQ